MDLLFKNVMYLYKGFYLSYNMLWNILIILVLIYSNSNIISSAHSYVNETSKYIVERQKYL